MSRVILDLGGLTLFIEQAPEGLPPAAPAPHLGIEHIGLGVLDIDATYAELRRETDRLARGLSALGVGDGDAVGIFMPMLPETVAAVMAAAKLGAIWVPIFSGFGPDAVASRLADARASVLLTVDGTRRKGAPVAMKAIADAAATASGSVRHVVVLPRLGDPDAPWSSDRSMIERNGPRSRRRSRSGT